MDVDSLQLPGVRLRPADGPTVRDRHGWLVASTDLGGNIESAIAHTELLEVGVSIITWADDIQVLTADARG